MFNLDRILELINECWSDKPQQLEFCNHIINYLSSVDKYEAQHLTINNLKRIGEKKLENEDVIEIIQFLSGDMLNVLESRYEYISEEDETYQIPKNYIIFSQDSLLFLNPETGQEIEDADTNIYIYWAMSNEFQKLLNKENV